MTTRLHALCPSETHGSQRGRRPQLIPKTLVAGAMVGLLACRTETIPERAELAKAKPVCAVLSVGAEKGLAHIGVLEAMNARGIQPECIFGNSMGALVGGLYAAHPEHDLRAAYRSLMDAYVEKTKTDKEEAAVLTFVGAMLFGAMPAEAVLGGASAAALVYERAQARFVKVLDVQLEAATIQRLPVQFGTWHQTLEVGPTTVTITSGNLADAIGDSAANPMIFNDVEVRPGARFDPGADRVSAIPLDDACRLRPDAHFIVSNVTGGSLYLSSLMNCSYEEIRIDPPEVDVRKAFVGEAPDFDAIVSAGFAAANDALGSGRPAHSASHERQR